MDLTEIDKEFYAIIKYNYTLDEQYALRVWAEEMNSLIERINDYSGRKDTND